MTNSSYNQAIIKYKIRNTTHVDSEVKETLYWLCFVQIRRTGSQRPTAGPFFGKRFRDRNADRHKRKPPRGMHINHDDIVALASSNSNRDELLANLDREIVALLSQVRIEKFSHIFTYVCFLKFWFYVSLK